VSEGDLAPAPAAAQFNEFKRCVVEEVRGRLDALYDQTNAQRVTLRLKLKFVAECEDYFEFLGSLHVGGNFPGILDVLYEYTVILAPTNVFAEQLAHDSNIIRTKLRNRSLPALIEHTSALHRGTPELKFWKPHLGKIKEIWGAAVGGYSTAGPHSMFRGQEPQLYKKPRELNKKRNFPVDRDEVDQVKKETAYKRRKRSEYRRELNKQEVFRNVLGWSREK